MRAAAAPRPRAAPGRAALGLQAGKRRRAATPGDDSAVGAARHLRNRSGMRGAFPRSTMYYRVLTAFFPGRTEAVGALGRLLAIGVAAEDISMIPRQTSRLNDIGLTIRSKASEGAALGAVVGGILGGSLAAFAAAGALIIPGLDAFFAGPLVAALAGAGAAGAVGTLLGALLGARLPEYEARHLEDAVEEGGALLAVRCPAAVSRSVEEALCESGGSRIRNTVSRRP